MWIVLSAEPVAAGYMVGIIDLYKKYHIYHVQRLAYLRRALPVYGSFYD